MYFLTNTPRLFFPSDQPLTITIPFSSSVGFTFWNSSWSDIMQHLPFCLFLFSICRPLGGCLFRTFIHFKVGCLFSYCLIWWVLGIVLEISPFWDTYMYVFCKYFLQSLLCFFIFLSVSLAEKTISILIQSKISIFYFTDSAFGVYQKLHHQTQSHLHFLLCYPLEVVEFHIWHLGLQFILSIFVKVITSSFRLISLCMWNLVVPISFFSFI